VVATQPAPPAQVAQATATIHSLSALATATEPPVERKHSVVAQPAPDSGGERQRKEPRLAVPAPQSAVKNEIKPVEQPLGANDAPSGMAGDGSQRPQRWGFWRGNR
jgi:hypothetical protein